MSSNVCITEYVYLYPSKQLIMTRLLTIILSLPGNLNFMTGVSTFRVVKHV